MRRRRDRMNLNADINVVSLIDVMMLLMVIFMITAPIMQGGIDINLPKAEAKPLEPKSGLVVSIDRQGGIHIEDANLT
ncbi:MAG: biopolymer transporter ExbD, partial [Gemmatimonadaceae bacterium]|nr:biopolymer transporter ExbD [Gemmatimonadaceae bacterium]